MPVDDGSPGIIYHFRPMLLFQLFATVTQPNFANGIRAANAVVIEDRDLQRDFPQHAFKGKKM